jgi:hypothetical protein
METLSGFRVLFVRQTKRDKRQTPVVAAPFLAEAKYFSVYAMARIKHLGSPLMRGVAPNAISYLGPAQLTDMPVFLLKTTFPAVFIYEAGVLASIEFIRGSKNSTSASLFGPPFLSSRCRT